MSADRRTVAAAYVALPALLAISTGCQAITTIFETGIWVGVIMVVLVLGLIAWLMSKFRGGGGTPRGTINMLLGVMLASTALSAAPEPDTDTQAAPRPQGGRPEVEQPVGGDQRAGRAPVADRTAGAASQEILLQGCLARDDGWRPDGQSSVARGDRASGGTAAAEDRGEMFVLRHASALPDDSADRTGRPATQSSDGRGAGVMYRLVPGSGVSLSTHEQQHVEIRGRLEESSDSTSTAPTTTPTGTSATSPRDSQAVQGGQMQAVGQTMAPGQGGQSGQSTATPSAAGAAPGVAGGATGSAGDQLPTVIVTSLRMLAPTCPSQR